MTLIILAGGDGTRMQPASLITPKPLLTAFDDTLLIRQIRQANEARIDNVVVSTNPKDLTLIQKIIKQSALQAKVLKNEMHSKGSLPALEFAISRISSENVLMSFADIYFFNNPFKSFVGLSKHTLGISGTFDTKELSLGGVVLVKDNMMVEKIIEMPFKNNKGYRWNGLALFKIGNRSDLTHFLSVNKANSPEGDFFEYLRKSKQVEFFFVKCSDFINVNRPENLLVASMYRFSEIKKSQKLFSLANECRKHILSEF